MLWEPVKFSPKNYRREAKTQLSGIPSMALLVYRALLQEWARPLPIISTTRWPPFTWWDALFVHARKILAASSQCSWPVSQHPRRTFKVGKKLCRFVACSAQPLGSISSIVSQLSSTSWVWWHFWSLYTYKLGFFRSRETQSCERWTIVIAQFGLTTHILIVNVERKTTTTAKRLESRT